MPSRRICHETPAPAAWGGYSGRPERGISILDGIKNKVGKPAEILYAEGGRITETEPGMYASGVKPGDPKLNSERIREAVRTARKADLVIPAPGGNGLTASIPASRKRWNPRSAPQISPS